MTFDTIAKDLLRKQKVPDNLTGNEPKSTIERANALVELAEAGFSRKDIFDKLSELYDDFSDEDKAVKKAILDMVIKVHGLYKDDEKKEAPTFIFNINADPSKINKMLCPPLPELTA